MQPLNDNDPNVIVFDPVDFNDPVYWELALIVWPARVDENGDVVKTGPARIEKIDDNGVENLTGLSDCWQVTN